MDEHAKINIQTFAMTGNYGSSFDPVRNDLESYWISDDAGTPGMTLKKTHVLYKTSGDSKWPFDYMIGNQITYKFLNNDDDYGSYKIERAERFEGDLKTYSLGQFFEIDSANVSYEDEDWDESTLADNFYNNVMVPAASGVVYVSSYFQADTPIEYASKVDNNSLIQGDIDFTYNYGSEEYEILTSPEAVEESRIANFYTVMTRPPAGDIKRMRSGAPPPKVPRVPRKRNKRASLRDMQKGYRDLNIKDYIITRSAYIQASSLVEDAKSFPFYTMISFTNPPKKKDSEDLRAAIIDNQFTAMFCDLLNLVESELAPLSESYVNTEKYQNSKLISQYKQGSDQSEFEEKYTTQVENILKYDLSWLISIMYDFIDGDTVPIPRVDKDRGILDTSTFSTLENRIPKSSEYNFVGENLFKRGGKNLTAQGNLDFVVDKLEKIIGKYSRSFVDILAGKTPYCSDVLFYSIEKYEFGSTTPLQTFWIPSVFLYLGMDYVDTQVKYGKKYTYKVFAYKITLDTEYSYVVMGPDERIDDDPGEGTTGSRRSGAGSDVRAASLHEARQSEDEYGSSSSSRGDDEEPGEDDSGPPEGPSL